MLFTDRPIICFADCIAIDSNIEDVASTEHIPVAGDTSFVEQAISEVGNMIVSNMQSFAYNYSDTSQLFIHPSMGSFSDSTPRPRVKLSQVVANNNDDTFWSPLKRLTVFVALRNFYQDASNRRTEDKYEKKAKKYECDVRDKLWPTLKSSGLPVTFNELNAPGAKYIPASGSFNSANLSGISGGAELSAAYDCAITWIRSNGNLVESGPSATASITLLDSQHLSVSIAGLTVPANVTSWNLYVGAQGGDLFYQTSANISIPTQTLSGPPTLAGSLVGRGQGSDRNLVFVAMLNRT